MLTKEQLEMIRGIGGEDMVQRAQAAENAKEQAAKSNDILSATKTQPSLIELAFKTRPVSTPLIEQLMKGGQS